MYWRLLLLAVGAFAYDWQKYEGHRVIQFTPTKGSQIKAVDEFSIQEGVVALKDAMIAMKAEYLVSQELFGAFKSMLRMNGMTFEISEKNMAADMKVEWDRMLARGYPNMAYNYNDYNTRADIYDEMDRLAGLCSGALTCSTFNLPGNSHDNNQVKAFEMSADGTSGTIVIDVTIHAREWLATTTGMRILDQMVTTYGSDSDVTNILNQYDFVFIPVMNPDGHDYTYSNDRLWRKNRRDNIGSGCYGVDLNRNWDSNWSGPGASGSPCSDTYYGPSAASEPETQAVVNYYGSYSGASPFKFGFSVHSYGYYLLHPWGDCTNPSNIADITRVSNAGCNAIENTHNTNWDCGNSCQVLYATSGGSIDWQMETGGYEYAYTPEMRGNSFIEPVSQIPLAHTEIWNGLVAMWGTM